MPSDLSLVRQLQEQDQRIQALTEEIDGLPKHVAAIQAKLSSHQQQLAEMQAQLSENAKEHRSLEGQIGDFQGKIAKLQDQMNGAKTNDQFRAFQHEIQFCKDNISQLEERILDKMEQADGLRENVAKAEAALKIETAKIAEEVEQAKARIEADKSERNERQAERDALSAQVQASTLRIYERVRQTRGTAVTEVAEENCGACHVRLRPQFLQDLRRLEQGVLTCERCGLILYVPALPENPEPVEDLAAKPAP